jgi:hypothetical protein
MTDYHHLSHADQLWRGKAYYGRAGNARRGVLISALRAHNFGAPAAAVSNGVSVSQTITFGTTPLATITGSLATAGVATFDVPRNVVAAWTTSRVLTVTGTDQYGETVVESSASGTTFAGKKAFKTVTSVSMSGDCTGLTVGSGDVLGLPVRCDANDLFSARANNAIDAGTFVPADTTSPATATTGDVRGTFDPAVALNASNTCKVLLHIGDTSSKEGAYGYAQFGG